MIHKSYLSRAQTRAMALDHPVGDPTGGAPYGEKNDPVSAVISIASMAGTYAAAGYSIAAMSLAQGLVFAGGALSLAGNITGSKTLSRLGMVTGLAGGLGSVFAPDTFGPLTSAKDAAAGAQGATESIAAPSSALSESANLTPVTDGAQAAASNASNVGGTLGPDNIDVGGGYNAGTGTVSPQSVNTLVTPTSASAAPADGLIASQTPAASTVQSAGTDPAFTGRTSTGLMTLANDVDNVVKPGVMDSIKAGNYGDALATAGSNVMDLAKNNQGAAMMLGNAATGVANWLSGKTDAEIAALEAQARFGDARAQQIAEEIAKEKRRRQNINQNLVNVQTGIRANPNAQIQQPWNTQQQQQPQPMGLINAARAA